MESGESKDFREAYDVGLIPNEAIGWTSPFVREDLPKPLPLDGLLSRRITDTTEAGRRAQRDLAELGDEKY